MKKTRMNITVDQDIDLWLRTSDKNRSEMLNNYLRNLMDVEQDKPIDESELESEISFHEQKISYHRQEAAVKKAQLANLQAERQREQEEQEKQFRHIVELNAERMRELSRDDRW